MRLIPHLLILLGAVFGASCANAAPIQSDVVAPGGFVTACAQLIGNGNGFNVGDNLERHFAPNPNCQSQFFSGLSSASATQADSGGGNYFNSSAAEAQLKLIKLRAANSSSNNAPFSQGQSQGGFAEGMVITAPGRAGQAGIWAFSVDVSGAFRATGAAGRTFLRVAAFKDEVELLGSVPHFDDGNADPISTDRQRAEWGLTTNTNTAQDISRTIQDEVQFALPFVFGQSFTFSIYASAHAGQRSVGLSNDFSSAAADFFSTVTFDRTSAIYAGDALLDSFTLTSASGLDYVGGVQPPPPPISEPATLVLALGGLGLLLRRTHRHTLRWRSSRKH
jgi:hypothetical protein